MQIVAQTHTHPVRLLPAPDPRLIAEACAAKALRDLPQTHFETVVRDGRTVYRVHRGPGHRGQLVDGEGCSCTHYREVCSRHRVPCTHMFLVLARFNALPWLDPDTAPEGISKALTAAERRAARSVDLFEDHRKQVLFSVPNPETGLPAFEVILKNGHPKLSFFGREGDTVFSVETEETDGEAEGVHLQLSDHKGNVRISSYAGETGGDLLLFSRGPKGRDDIAASLQSRDGEGYLSVKPVADVNYAIRIGREE